MAKAGQTESFYSLNRHVLITAVEALQIGDNRTLESMGVSVKMAEEIRSIDLEALTKGKNFPASIVDIKINPRSLSLFLNHVSEETQQDRLIDDSMRLGIRQPMLLTLFGVSRNEYDARRDRLGLPNHVTGRIESLDEESEVHVYMEWQKFRAENSSVKTSAKTLEGIVSVCKSTGQRADQVWVALFDHGGVELQ